MNDPRTEGPLTEAEQREWLAQERAWRDERAGAAIGDDPQLASYRVVLRALRAPIAPALPEDFARSVAARCRIQGPAAVDTRLELQVQRALLGLLGAAALAALAIYGGDWWQATAAALPVLDGGTALNWTAALAACLGLSWATDAIGRRANAMGD